MIPRARFLVALTVSNVSKCGTSAGFAPDSLFFQKYFRQFSEIYRYLRGIVVSLLPGLLPKFSFFGKKANVANVFLARKRCGKSGGFSPFFFASIFQKVFGKNQSFQMYRVSFFQICFIFPMFFRTSFLRRVFESEINPKKQKLYEYFQDLTLWLRRVFEYPRHRDDDSNWHRVNRPMDPAFSDLPLRQPTRVEIIPKNTCHEHVQQNRMITEYPRIN